MFTLDLDECFEPPCHRGECVDLFNGFRCDCPPGWTGDSCDGKKELIAALSHIIYNERLVTVSVTN